MAQMHRMQDILTRLNKFHNKGRTYLELSFDDSSEIDGAQMTRETQTKFLPEYMPWGTKIRLSINDVTTMTRNCDETRTIDA